MAVLDDDHPISGEDVRRAVASGQLGASAEGMARARHWTALLSLLEQLDGMKIALAPLSDAMRSLLQALRPPLAERRRDRASPPDVEILRTFRILAGESILARVRRPAMTETDRGALRVAATAFAEAGDWVRAAMASQDALDWPAAADAWGRLGDLDAMELCMAEDEAQRRERRSTLGAFREIEELIRSGERFAALRLAAAMPQGIDDAEAVRKIILDLTARLIRGRSVALRPPAQPPVRFAGAPAMLGRDAQADVVMRDPGVSRQHARIEWSAGALCLSDAGSRGGTFVAGARIERPFPLRGDTEVRLGHTCSLEMTVPGPGRVYLRGTSGLDRGLRAAVGVDAIPLVDFWPAAKGTWIEFGEIGARMHHTPETMLRIDGHRTSMRVDLLHGETVQIGGENRVGDRVDSRTGLPGAASARGAFLLEIE